MSEERWQVVRGDAAAGVVVVVDFDGGRPDGRLAELVGRARPEPAVVQPRVTAFGVGEGVRLVDGWAASARVAGWTIELVVGRCAGAALACGLAGALARGGDARPQVVLLDPYRVGAGVLQHELSAALGQFEDLAEPELLSHAHSRVAHARESLDLHGFGAAVVQVYRDVAAEVLTPLDVDDDVVEELCSAFGVYVAYLLECAGTGYTSSRDADVILLSEDVPLPDGLAGSSRVVAVDADALLRSLEAVEALRQP
ncbi:hypothetical protein [uncultured Cellulomonas sp.]|uniref:hypothetical protein n=1 Tax=uncultured Cellulomonas sp. TaxID=189682 RepID=UPI0028F10A06|nr:hypothetical protein [uncultured Cellulomonas sp.]